MNDWTASEDEALAALRADFGGHRIWRAKHGNGQTGSWVATLIRPAAGVDPTVIAPNAVELREVLEREQRQAQAEKSTTTP